MQPTADGPERCDRERIAFLGPEGTYSHQAAFELFGSTAKYLPRSTIADTYAALKIAPYALLPWENSLHGSVIETLDLLRNEDIGRKVHITGEVTVPVQHCLLVRKGVRLSDVRKVMSHEQALGQCSTYLTSRLPRAELVKVPSTAEAARLVATAGDGAECAAISSKICLSLYPGLEIAGEGVQDANDNYTRFVLLGTAAFWRLPTGRCSSHAVLRLSTRSTGSFSLNSMLHLISGVDLAISRIDRRPSLLSRPFHDVYFLVFRIDESSFLHSPFDLVAKCRERLEELLRQMEPALREGGTADILGVWCTTNII